jgi:CHAT domain-containing protein/tetratricopeptide (TPR) repeat protein
VKDDPETRRATTMNGPASALLQRDRLFIHGFVFFTAACLSLAPLRAQSPSGTAAHRQGEPTFLALGKPIDREMRGGEKHSYKVHAEAGQFLRVVALQEGIDVLVVLLDTEGKQLLIADSMNGSHGPESVSVIVENPGDLQLDVSTTSADASAGHYQIQLTDLRAPTDADRTRIKAERTYAEGQLLYSRGDVESAKAAAAKWQESFALWQSLDDRYGQAISLYATGLAFDSMQNARQALQSYNQALALWRALGDRAGEAITLNNVGSVYSGVGEGPKALDYYNKALLLTRAVQDRAGEAATLNNIGAAYGDFGELQKAVDYYMQALPLLRAVNDRVGEGGTLTNIGLAYSDIGEKSKALEYYKHALSLQRQLGNVRGEADILTNLCWVYSEVGHKEMALNYCNQALLLVHAGTDRATKARALTNIGVIYYEFGDKQKALDFFAQSLPLSRALEDPMGEGRTLVLMMQVWKNLQNPSVAILFGKQGIDRFQQVRRNLEGLDKEAQQSFLKSKEDYYRELAELLISEGRLPEAQQVLDLLKAEDYSQFTQRRGDTGSGTNSVARTPMEAKSNKEYEQITAEIIAIGEEWTQLRANSSRSANEERRYNELSDSLTGANQRFQVFLETLYDSFGKNDEANAKVETINEQTAGLQTLVGELDAGTAAVYTLVLDQKCVLMVITPATRLAREIPISRIALRSKVFAFAQALAGHKPEEDIEAKAQELYNVLIAPIEKDLQGAQTKTLVWSLDDVLRYVPLAALYDGRQYLVERYRNVTISTASFGNLKDQSHVTSWRGVAMGVSKDYDGLGTLTAVPNELASVVRSDRTPGSHGPVPGTILLDDSFTETAMETALDQHPPLVHIASHYVFHVGDDRKSYLLLGGKDTGGQGFHLTLAELRDDQRLDFKGIELLTLSGCQTAEGSNDSDGREIDGLGTMAQRKGAKAVLATLWAVDDESVGLLMTTFYKLWVTSPGITKAAALQQAQLALLRGTGDPADMPHGSLAASSSASAPNPLTALKYANPYYWAPFILIGNWK